MRTVTALSDGAVAKSEAGCQELRLQMLKALAESQHQAALHAEGLARRVDALTSKVDCASCVETYH